MHEDLSGARHRSAIVDVTDRCNLRCKHCFYFREEHESEEMDADEFLEGLRILRDRHDIQSMGWSGGEPLYRREVVLEGAKLFPVNQLYTNGTLPLPVVPGLQPFVSVDGTREIHDSVRGKGAYDKVMENVTDSPIETVIFTATFHRLNEACLEDMIEELSRITKPKVVVTIMLFAPLKEYRKLSGYKHTDVQETALDFSWEERDRFLDRLIALRKKYPNFIINPDIVLEMMKSENAHEAISRCNMPRRTLTLDLELNRKLPCVLGAQVDCSKCGCAFPYEQEARRRGLKNKVMFSE